MEKVTKETNKEFEVEVKNLKGKKVGVRKLSQEIFGQKINFDLLKQVYVAIFSNQREVIAHSKNRSERAGSTRKPWKQKGTGRARTGSVRNPIWRKGGIIFGPTKERNFKKKVNAKMKQLAIKMALSGKREDKELVVVDSFSVDKKKTKEMAKALVNLGIAEKSVLIAFCQEEKENERVTRNIEKVRNIEIEKLNVFNILNSKFLLVSEKRIRLFGKKIWSRKRYKG